MGVETVAMMGDAGDRGDRSMSDLNLAAIIHHGPLVIVVLSIVADLWGYWNYR
jgi:hypothetical protein